VKAIGLSKKIELVVVSPLLRYLLHFRILLNHVYVSLLFNFFFFCFVIKIVYLNKLWNLRRRDDNCFVNSCDEIQGLNI
jgi:hypothetical protein